MTRVARKKTHYGRRDVKRASKTKARTKDLDQIHDDLKKNPVSDVPPEGDPDLPGGGLHYCVECAKHFVSQMAIDAHKSTKVHKKRLKLLQEPPYTQKEADAAEMMKRKNSLPRVDPDVEPLVRPTPTTAPVAHKSSTTLRNVVLLLASLAALAFYALAPSSHDPAAVPIQDVEAIAVLSPIGSSPVRGYVLISQSKGVTHITLNATGMQPGSTHAVHFHEYGDITDDAKGLSTGGHFNPHGAPHACPGAEGDAHAGDLGNVVVSDDGSVVWRFGAEGDGEGWSAGVTVTVGLDSVLGRAVVVHELADDCTSQPVGNAGGRLAHGVVGWRFGTPTYSASKQEPQALAVRAVSYLEPTEGSGVKGKVLFKQVIWKQEVEVHVIIDGLKPDSEYGFHLHQFGDMSDVKGMNAGGHFSVDGKRVHGCPSPSKDAKPAGSVHNGDLGNIQSDGEGKVDVILATDQISIADNASKDYLIGRGVIVHAQPDDCVSQPVGNAGARLAQGVVGIAKAGGK